MSLENIIIAGQSDFSTLMKLYLEQSRKYRVVAFSVEKQYIQNSTLDNLPVLPLEELNNFSEFRDCTILNTIGYKQMNGIRQKIHWRIKEMGRTLLTYIHPTAVVNSNAGEGSIVLDGCSIGFRCSVGAGTIMWNNVVIAHDVSIGDFTYWSPGAVCCGHVSVNDRCFIGANATIRNGISVAEETLVGAGVFLSRTITEKGKIFRAPEAELLQGIFSNSILR